MKLAAKQLLALGVPPHHITELDRHAEGEETALRVLVQRIIREWLVAHPKLFEQGDPGDEHVVQAH